ncbi:alpha/beta hydrolase [Yoonia sp. R2331]|uniref:alpha/beta hydrolase n=1 Tax=Yoonia sp. R2331 TaxID=3237238 RepID=UPI0034E42BAA
MEHFFTRRARSSDGKTFGTKPGLTTEYVRVSQIGHSGSAAAVVSKQKWAQEVLGSSQNGHVLVFVHGFNVKQNFFVKRLSKIRRGCQLAHFKGAVVGFDWPANGNVFHYYDDRRDMKKVSRHLVTDGIMTLLRARPTAKIHILAHSMGAYLTGLSLAAATGTQTERTLARQIGQVMFVGADNDQVWMGPGDWCAESVRRCSRRLTHYHSIHDQVLDISGKTFNIGTKRSGQHGLPHPATTIVRDVNCARRYQARYPGTPETTTTHNWYFDDPRFFADVVATMHGGGTAGMATRLPLADGHQELRPT